MTNTDTTTTMTAHTHVAIYDDGLGTVQARCLGCPWRGPWRSRSANGRSREERAADDAKDHSIDAARSNLR